MNQREFELESAGFLSEYLSESEFGPRFICGAYVGVRKGRIVIEHDLGWTAVASTGSPPIVLDYSPGGIFGGAAGRAALLEWLRP